MDAKKAEEKIYQAYFKAKIDGCILSQESCDSQFRKEIRDAIEEAKREERKSIMTFLSHFAWSHYDRAIDGSLVEVVSDIGPEIVKRLQESEAGDE